MVDVPKILKDLYAERDLIVEVITMLEKLNTTAVTEPAAMESRTSRDSKKKRAAAQPKGAEKAASKPAAKRAVKAAVTAPGLKPKAKKKELSPAARKRLSVAAKAVGQNTGRPSQTLLLRLRPPPSKSDSTHFYPRGCQFGSAAIFLCLAARGASS